MESEVKGTFRPYVIILAVYLGDDHNWLITKETCTVAEALASAAMWIECGEHVVVDEVIGSDYSIW